MGFGAEDASSQRVGVRVRCEIELEAVSDVLGAERRDLRHQLSGSQFLVIHSEPSTILTVLMRANLCQSIYG